MNTQPNKTDERDLVRQAAAAFQKATGFRTNVVADKLKTDQKRAADAVIRITQEERYIELMAEAKNAVDRVVTLANAQQQLAPFGKQGILVAPYLTTTMAKQCREQLHLQFMDAAGNAFIDQPGLYVNIQGQPRAMPLAPEGKGGTATGLKAVFAVLCRPELINAPYRDIARAADVAVGTVGWVLNDLNTRGLVLADQKAGKRRLLERKALLNEWITNYAFKLRPKLNIKRFRAPDKQWWQKVELHDLGAYWGGEVAAARLTGHLKPAKVTIYVMPEARAKTMAKLAIAHRLQADAQGDIEILDAFWRFPPDDKNKDIVPPLLAYADLVTTLDPRNIEVARLIGAQHLDYAPGTG
jgi:hypothetical protein